MTQEHTTQDEDAGQDALLEMFAEIREGEFLEEVRRKLAVLVASVQDVSAPGTLTIKLNVRPDGPSVEIYAEVDGKVPKRKPRPTTFWPTADGRLSRDDPRQTQMPFYQ
jgi:hypothetical protein